MQIQRYTNVGRSGVQMIAALIAFWLAFNAYVYYLLFLREGK